MAKLPMKLIAANGRELKVGSQVKLDGIPCTIVGISDENFGIFVETNDGEASWEVEPESFGARWDEEGFVNQFFEKRKSPFGD